MHRSEGAGINIPVEESSGGFLVGDRVQVWSSSARRWFDDGEVQAVNTDNGSVFVRFNNLHPSGKEVAGDQVSRILKRIPGSSACKALSTPADPRAFLRRAIGTGQGPSEARHRAREAFTHCDFDGDGVLSYEDIARYLGMLGIRATDSVLHAIFNAADPKASGKIDFSGFVAWLYSGRSWQKKDQEKTTGAEELPCKPQKEQKFPLLREEQPPPPSKKANPAVANLAVATEQLKKLHVLLPTLKREKVSPDLGEVHGQSGQKLPGAQTEGIFYGCTILVCPKGGTYMSAARRLLLQARIRDAGGSISEFWDEDVTHLVVVPRLASVILQQEYACAKEGPDFKAIVTDAWICDSLASGHRLSERRYIWRPPFVSSPEETATPQTPKRQAIKRQVAKSEDGESESPEQAQKRMRRTSAVPKSAFSEREGDWYCPKCKQHNFRSRTRCWRRECGQLKPGQEQGISAKSELGVEVGPAGATSISSKFSTPDDFRMKVIEEFRACSAAWAVRGDKWRSWQYKKAEQLVVHAHGTLEVEDLKKLGLTPKFVQKCEDIRQAGFLEQAANFRKDIDVQVLLELTRIHGVGPVLAQTWLRCGVRSLDDVRARLDTLPGSAGGPPTGLTKVQRLGLRFVDDFQVPVPRAEVERVSAMVQKHAEEAGLFGRIVPCGGYRHGDALCTAVTLVIGFAGTGSVEAESAAYLESMDASGVVVADLSSGAGGTSRVPTPVRVPGDEDPSGAALACHCVVRGVPAQGEPLLYRRCDFIFCRHSSLPFATLQWTGSDQGLFNREMKRIAALRGFHLSHTYMCKADREGTRGRQVGEVCRVGAKIECADEQAIFDVLGIPYRPPERREVDAELLAVVDRAAREAPEALRMMKVEIQGDVAASAPQRLGTSSVIELTNPRSQHEGR